MSINCLIRGHDWEVIKRCKRNIFGMGFVDYRCKKCFSKHREYLEIGE